MQQQKYSVNQHHIFTFLAFVRDGQIANYVLMQQEINIVIGAIIGIDQLKMKIIMRKSQEQ